MPSGGVFYPFMTLNSRTLQLESHWLTKHRSSIGVI